MSQSEVTWIVKFQNGQVKGPYTTKVILEMISKGSFVGKELISKVPDGEWIQITKETSFYDKLLETLEGVVTQDEKASAATEATVIVPPKAKAVEPTPAKLEKLKVLKMDHAPEISPPVSLPKPRSPGDVIELSNVSGVENEAIKKKLAQPILFLVIGLLIGILFLWDSGSDSSAKIHLLAPGKPTEALSDEKVKMKLNQALLGIEQDTFESYLMAQNNLVSIVEGAPLNIEVRALLCVVYKELWPFSFQDAQDIKTVATATQAARSINVVSPFGQVCEAIKLITAGRYKEARGVVESTLDRSEPFSMLPVLYNLKAELLEGEKDLVNAAPYFEKAGQLWDKWLRPQVSLGKLSLVQNEFAQAANIFKSVIAKNPRHKEAKILLGLVEFRGYKNTDAAYNSLSAAYNEKGRVHSLVEADGLAVLAEIYVMRGQRKKALEAAQRGLQLSPNNSQLRQLVVRLGGSDKLGSTATQNTELLYLGDQYMRQGDYLAAQAEFKAAFELDPKSGTAAYKAAKCLWQLNQSHDAISWLNKAIKAEPKLTSAYVLLADYLSQRYDFLGATQILTNATKVAPNNYEVYRGLATLEFRKNNLPGAIAYAQRGLRIYDGDLETYILLAKANSLLARAIVPVNKKEIERKENAAKDAIRFATKAVEIDSTSPEAQITYAKMLAQTNGIESAITYLNELVKRFSYTVDYKIALADIYKSEDRFRQALEIFERVTEFEPKNKMAWLGLGESQMALGMSDKALRSYLNAAALDPKDGEAMFQIGKIFIETNKYDQAIQQFNRVQRLNPSHPRTHYYIGKAAFLSGDYVSALESAKAEKRQNPNVADSYILAAEVYAVRKQYGECATEYSHALKLRPQGADIYVKAAMCYRQSGSIDVAEDMLALAQARESGYAEIYREQGAIYQLKGDARSAAQAYNKYLGLSPNAPDRAEIESKLSRQGN